MCDQDTLKDGDDALVRKGLSRREFAGLSAAATLAGCAGVGMGAESGEELTETVVRVTTEDGVADAFFVHPARGRHPGVIMWPDIAGVREAKKIMARQLAANGYAVLCVNPYYRSAPAPVMESFAEFMQPEGRDRVLGYRALLTPDAIARDAKAFVAFLDGSDAVDKARGIGSHGFCMGGPFTVRTAAASPARVRAAASFHGGGLVTPDADSPHKLLAATKASYLIAVARNDDAKVPTEKDVFRQAAKDAGRPAEIEGYPADHGWMVPDAPAWDPIAADKGFQRMLVLYKGL